MSLGWRDEAACRRSVIGFKPVEMIGNQGRFIGQAPMSDEEWGVYQSEMFFPERGDLEPEGKKFCADCPVKKECLEAGLQSIPGYFGQLAHGIWGGESVNARKRMRVRAY